MCCEMYIEVPEEPESWPMGIGKEVAVDLKIANTMQLRGIWVALFEMGGPCVSPSLVMKKTSKILRAPRYRQREKRMCVRILVTK